MKCLLVVVLFSCIVGCIYGQGDMAVKLPGYGMSPAQADIYQQNRKSSDDDVFKRRKRDNNCLELNGAMAVTWGMSQREVENIMIRKGGILDRKTNRSMKFTNVSQGEIPTDSIILYFKDDNVFAFDIFYPRTFTDNANLKHDAQNIFSDVRASLTSKYYPPQCMEKIYKKEEYKQLSYSGELEKINDGGIDLYSVWAFDKNCEVKSTIMNLPTIVCNYANIFLTIHDGLVKCTYNDSKYSIQAYKKIYKKQTDDF